MRDHPDHQRRRPCLTAASCAKCHHPKSRHRTHECRTVWQTRGQTFMGISTITKWCTCDRYEPIEEKS